MSIWTDQVDRPMGQHPYPAPAERPEPGSPYPQRIPGTHMSPNLHPIPSFTPAAPELLAQIVEDLQHLGDDPAPEARPKPAGFPEGVVRGMLTERLWEAARWYEHLDYEGCAGCKAAGEPCVFHAPKAANGTRYEDLYDWLVTAPSDAAALLGTATAIVTGHAVLGDIAPLGSPLEALLLDRLTRLDTEEVAR